MVGDWWTSMVQRVVGRQLEARVARDQAARSRLPADPTTSLGLRLTGEVTVLDRLVAVRPHTIAIIFVDGEPPRVRRPGDYLKPRLLPKVHPVRVLPVNTEPVSLDVTIDQLPTLDGFEIERTTIRVTVQLADDEHYAWVGDLAAEFGTELEAHLLERVRAEMVTGARSAVRINRLADVRRLTLQNVLSDRWLPRTFGGGSLVRRDFSVLGSVWPAEADPASPSLKPRSAAQPGADPPPVGTGRAFRLEVDAELAKVWRQHAGSDPRGIAGAQVPQATTVIAVTTGAIGEYERSRLTEAYGEYFEDRRVHLVTTTATSYADLVKAWFSQMGSSPGRLVSVEASDPEVLRVVVDQALASSEEVNKGLTVGSPADREALGRLVPHRRLTFVRAESTRASG